MKVLFHMLKDWCSKHVFHIGDGGFTYKIFISHMELRQLQYEMLFSYVKLNEKFL